MKITKLLALDARPAPALLTKAKKIALTYAERLSPPASFTIGEDTFENAMNASRPIEVGDAALDEKGHFYVFEARPEALYKVTGDEETLKEAAWAFLARGMRIADSVDGFVIVQKEQFKSMLESVGLTVTSFIAPFTPIPLPRHEHHGGCCCGAHHHHEGECSCRHHHHHEEGEGCSCGHHHHHEDDEECSCGHHHHHDED